MRLESKEGSMPHRSRVKKIMGCDHRQIKAEVGD